LFSCRMVCVPYGQPDDTHTYTHALTNTYAHNAHTHTTHIHIHTYAHTHTHTHIHTHTHTHTHNTRNTHTQHTQHTHVLMQEDVTFEGLPDESKSDELHIPDGPLGVPRTMMFTVRNQVGMHTCSQ